MFNSDKNSTPVAFIAIYRKKCDYHVMRCTARRKESAPSSVPACRLLLRSRNRSQMFNSTSRYLVYCTINRGKESYNHTAIRVTVVAIVET